MGQLCQRTVHIQVCLHSCRPSVCTWIFEYLEAGVDGKSQSYLLLRVITWWGWLHHHIGNNWASAPRSAACDNISTGQTMWRDGGSTGSSHYHLPATTREGSQELPALSNNNWTHVLLHVNEDTELDAERIIHQFSRQKNRHLALLFRPKWRRRQVTEVMLKTIHILKYHTYTIYRITLSWLMIKRL